MLSWDDGTMILQIPEICPRGQGLPPPSLLRTLIGPHLLYSTVFLRSSQWGAPFSGKERPWTVTA